MEVPSAAIKEAAVYQRSWAADLTVRSIEQHFPLIWRTSIMLYESTLNASPHRVRVCTPAADGESFDCRDEIERAKIVPIPAQAPLLAPLHQPNAA